MRRLPDQDSRKLTRRNIKSWILLWTKKHEMARQLFRDFAEKEVKPLAIEVDETEEFPRVTVDKMIKAGFMGIPYTEGIRRTGL